MPITSCVGFGSSPPRIVEDLGEDRDDEQEHEDEDERRERDDDARVDHRALDATPELVLLLDLRGGAVEHRVERSRRLAGLDHRDVEAVEDLRVARERLGQHHAALDVSADLGDDLAEVLVLRLLLERHERSDDADAGLDHRRELAREDLKRLRLDLLERRARAALAARRALAQRLGQQPAGLKLLARRREVRGVDLAAELDALRIDCVICECGHVSCPLFGLLGASSRSTAGRCRRGCCSRSGGVNSDDSRTSARVGCVLRVADDERHLLGERAADRGRADDVRVDAVGAPSAPVSD